MSDPPRLLEQPGTQSSTLELLRALDAPHALPPAMRAALVKDLSGLVAGAGIKTAAAAIWAKVALATTLGLGVGGALWWSQVAPAPGVAAPKRATLARPAPAPQVTLPPQPTVPPSVSPPGVAAPERVKSAAPATPRDSLAEEEALLEAARQALSQNPAHALVLLQKHRSQFPSGQLSAERMYLSVDCWQRVGNAAAAQREAAALTKYYPNSAYARRAPLLLSAPKR